METIMIDNILKLYQQINKIASDYLIGQKRNNIDLVKKIIPQIQEFTLWFLKENKFGMKEELYQELSRNLVFVLEDIYEALKQEDRVLLHDALTYGLREYLLIFVKTNEERKNDNL